MRQLYDGKTFMLLSLLLPLYCFASTKNQIAIAPDGYAYLASASKENSIIKYDPKKNLQEHYFYINDPTDCKIIDIAIDPTARLIAYSTGCRYKSLPMTKLSAEGLYILKILNMNSKKELASIDHVNRRYSFSPHGDSIAYAEEIPGYFGSPAPPGYRGGVWIYNFDHKSKKQIYGGSKQIMGVNWSEHDDNIYFTDNVKVFKYSLAKVQLETLSFNCMYFTADGKYCIDNISKDISLIIRTLDHKEMQEWQDAIREGSPSIGLLFLSKNMKSGVFSIGNSKNVIFNFDQGKIIRRFSGQFLGTNTEGTLAAIHPISSEGKAQIDKVEILNLLDLIKK
jgi:hypothetical protein